MRISLHLANPLETISDFMCFPVTLWAQFKDLNGQRQFWKEGASQDSHPRCDSGGQAFKRNVVERCTYQWYVYNGAKWQFKKPIQKFTSTGDLDSVVS